MAPLVHADRKANAQARRVQGFPPRQPRFLPAVIPIIFRLDEGQREALRSANGANLEHERWTSIAWAVLPAVCLAVVLAILLTG